MERKIGEVFDYKGKKFEVVEGNCNNCNFLHKELSFEDAANLGSCIFRYDRKTVYFKLIE